MRQDIAKIVDGEVAPPRLETDRLILAGHQPGDFAPLAAMWADPEVVRYISGRPSSRSDSWMRLLRYRGLWPLLGYGYWAIREKHTGRFVGDLGFADFHREIEPSIRGVPEAGWVLASWAHGQGFAGEALGAALAWLDRQAGLERSVCLIAPANVPSLRLAEKNGYRLLQTIRFHEEETAMLVRPRPGTLSSPP
jgi:RimJ/RimL family protein N-acetyltransferase